jgi:hypothetical protein
MSLLRLLATGKSLVGIKDTESRYRLTTQRLLPQFGPTKNPFRGSEKLEPAQTEAQCLGDDGGNGAAGEENGNTNSCGAPAVALQRGAPDRVAFMSAGIRRFMEVLRLRAAALVNGCQAKLAGWLGRVRARNAKPAIPRFPKPPVQGELSLDKIKVVRNDLSDADIQVVPARVPTVPASSSPTSRTEDNTGVGESRFERATAELFGAGKT